MQDLEAQKPHDAPAPEPVSTEPHYARAGRGGAGNFRTPPSASEAARDAAELAEKVHQAAEAKRAGPHASGALSGRGGAGNWAAGAAAREEEERLSAQETAARDEAIKAKIAEEVEKKLAMPQKTYHAGERAEDA